MKRRREIKNIMIFISIIYLHVICSNIGDVNINRNGIDDENIVTGGEFYSLLIASYSAKYYSCGFSDAEIFDDPLYLLYIFNSPFERSGSTGLHSNDFSSIIPVTTNNYYYKKDADYCSRSILVVPCQSSFQELSKSLQFSVLKNCESNPASIRKSGDGNW
ncbi:hypothetical protein MAL01_07215 [Leptospira noguchii]|uniref:hypothetical protein n=1 Tax=Leptospira noguchii TaxID=28182 RepID=UPI001FB77F35|nr:hypothetical protein [Leptospira noguchii]UOG35446.1 hypothetical protein MAL02_07070 [Leptospira noguchii]UOG46365.1 hypothetical protein MAL01_07215 [Leptospira noguchii]